MIQKKIKKKKKGLYLVEKWIKALEPRKKIEENDELGLKLITATYEFCKKIHFSFKDDSEKMIENGGIIFRHLRVGNCNIVFLLTFYI